MGFLSFLSRKSSSIKGQHDTPIITQAYFSTIARVPPVLGEYPLGGNGSRNTLEGLTNYHPLAQPQRRVQHIAPLDEGPAPAPFVPTFRNDSSERPESAPNMRPRTANWSMTSRSRLRKKTLSSSNSEQQSLRAEYASGGVRQTSSRSDVQPLPSRARPHTARPPSSQVPNAAGRGYKDLLDAQSELKPLDFKSRIKASGVRDYGEDVADRNIGENSHNLELPQVQAFYSRSSYGGLAGKPGSMSSTSTAHQRHESQCSELPQSASTEPHLRERTKSWSSSNAPVIQQHRISDVPELRSPQTAPHASQKTQQRPKTSDAAPRHQSWSPHSSIVSDAVPKSNKLKVRRLAYRGGPPLPMSPLRNSLETGTDDSVRATSQHQFGSPEIIPAKQENTSDGQVIPKHEEAQSTVEDRGGLHDRAQPAASQRAFPLKPSKPSTRRHSVAVSTATSANQETGFHSAHPSLASSIASFHTATEPDFAGAASSARQRANSTKAAKRASLPHSVADRTSPHRAVDDDPAVSPILKTGVQQFESDDLHDDTQNQHHPRTKSPSPDLPNLTPAADPSEAVPPRSSSVRNWSISSATTPPGSDTSSNPSPDRPLSRNTANTSVDLGKDFNFFPSPMTKHPSASHPNLPTAADRTPRSPTFNIDDYISSDDDANSLEPRIPRGEGEEDLLFSLSGYGEGAHLPGLFDAPVSNSPPGRQVAVMDDFPAYQSARPRSSASLPTGQSRSTRGWGALPRQKRYILDTAADSDSDSDTDSDSDSSLSDDDGGSHSDSNGEETGETHAWHQQHADAPPSFHSTTGRRLKNRNDRHTRRLSAMGSHHVFAGDVIIEERDPAKIDIAAAVRQRKEEKMRKRTGALTAASRRKVSVRKGKEKMGERKRLGGGEVVGIET